MTKTYLRIILACSLASLTGCAQQAEVRQMSNQVSTLNHEMMKLSQQTVALTQQNSLNAKSTSGVYLLPDAQTGARLNSQLGNLKMSLTNISAVADGTRLTLLIQSESSEPLPAFSGKIEWGQIQGTTESFQEVNLRNQTFDAPASLMAPAAISIPLQLAGITPQQAGFFVRIHDIEPTANVQ